MSIATFKALMLLQLQLTSQRWLDDAVAENSYLLISPDSIRHNLYWNWVCAVTLSCCQQYGHHFGPVVDKRADYPVPKMDRLVLLGLMLPTEDAVLHFKLWYENGSPNLNFEQDLIIPLLTYWSWCCGKHSNIRGIDFGMGNITPWSPAFLDTPFGQKYPEPDHYDPYPLLDINKVPEDEGEEKSVLDHNQPKVMGHSPSGAKIYG